MKARKILAKVPANKFPIGSLVSVESDYNDDYHGKVIEVHERLEKPNYRDESVTAPGITVRVLNWEGFPHKHSEKLDIVAHDDETRPMREELRSRLDEYNF